MVVSFMIIILHYYCSRENIRTSLVVSFDIIMIAAVVIVIDNN